MVELRSGMTEMTEGFAAFAFSCRHRKLLVPATMEKFSAYRVRSSIKVASIFANEIYCN